MAIELVWVQETDDIADAERDGVVQGYRFIADGKEWSGVPIDVEGYTLENIAYYLDRKAVGANHHELNSAHAWLGKQIAEIAGEDIAKQVLRRIAEAGGLMNGDF